MEDHDEYTAQVEAEVERILVNFRCQTDALQLPPLLSTEISNSLRLSTLRSVTINGGSKEGGAFRLNDEQIGHFSQCIIKCNLLLECLSLPYHNITDIGLGYICQTLLCEVPVVADEEQQNMRLEVLDLEGNEITARGLHLLRLHSTEKCSLLSLNLSCNRLEEQGGMIIAEALTTNRTLRQLIVNNCGFSLNATIAVATSLGKLSKMGKPVLEELQIDRPYLGQKVGEDAVDHFSRVCANTNVSLAALSLKHYSMGDLSCRYLANALTRSVSLVSLNLECNKIGAAGAESLASYIILRAKNGMPGLRSLRMSYNCIGDDGAIALSQALAQTTSLLEISLKNNSIGVGGLVAIGRSLFTNNTLEAISLFGNDFDSKESGKLFHDLLTERVPYIGLVLDIIVYNVDGVYMVAENNLSASY